MAHFELKEELGSISFKNKTIAIASPNDFDSNFIDTPDYITTDNKTYHFESLALSYNNQFYDIILGDRHIAINVMDGAEGSEKYINDDEYFIGASYIQDDIGVVDVSVHTPISSDVAMIENWSGVVKFWIALDHKSEDYFVFIEGVPDKNTDCERFVSIPE